MVGTFNDAARNLIDEAGGARSGWERDSLLRDALAELGDHGGERDDIEARAVILALRAQADPAYLPDAEQMLSEVRQRGEETNWISLHLVDAYYIARDYENVIRHAREVDQSFFDDQDLHWRSLKVTEILAASLLARGSLRELREGMDLAMQVCHELASPGGGIDQDDLASPTELAARALDMVNNPASDAARSAGCETLRGIAQAVDVQNWFPDSSAAEITAAIENCG